jgi:hypothetical protein
MAPTPAGHRGGGQGGTIKRWIYAGILALVITGVSVVLPGQPDGPRRLVPPPGQANLTRSQAIAAASASTRAGGPARAALMDYGPATGLVGVGSDPRLAPSTPVWVVTVYRPQQYTVILDGASGAVLNSCMGCGSA